MSFPPFILVTGNPDKVTEAERILGFRPRHEPLDLPEIQSLDLAEVLEAKVEEAYRRFGEPVVVEETGLYLDAMNGFPGPLVKWMLDAMGPEGIAATCSRLGNDGAEVRTALAYFDGERMQMAEGTVRGRLAPEPRGKNGFGWDPVFMPESEPKTYAELDPEEKDRFGHRGRAWVAFRNLFVAES